MNNPENEKTIKETLEKLKDKSPEEISEIIKDNLQTDELSREDEINRRLWGGLPPRQPVDESFDFSACRKKYEDDIIKGCLQKETLFPPPYGSLPADPRARILPSPKPSSALSDYLIAKLIEKNCPENLIFFGSKSEIQFQEKDGRIQILEVGAPVSFDFIYTSPPSGEAFDAMTYTTAAPTDEEPISFEKLMERWRAIKAEILANRLDGTLCAGLGMPCGRTATHVFRASLPKFSSVPPPVAPDMLPADPDGGFRHWLDVEVFLCAECAGQIKPEVGSKRDVSIGYKTKPTEDKITEGRNLGSAEAFAEKVAGMTTAEIEKASVCKKPARRTARKGRKGAK